jgi:hypothetical protein
MDQNEYRAMKESGVLVTDAALQEEPKEAVIVTEEEKPEVVEENQEVEEEQEEILIEDEDEELPALSEKEKTAFEKRMERERKKERERIEAEYEQKYGKHKSVIDMLGGDPDVIEQRLRDNQMAQEARRLAEQNGWNEEQTKWYVEQQKQQQELRELRVQMQINKLKDNPDYAGIGTMEKEIMSKIDKTNGALTVEEAYWAMGGPRKAEQIRLEAQMREAEKRKKTPRTVITDSPSSTTGEKPLPPEIAQQAERMGISAAEARRLMNSEPAKNIDDWRAKQKAK